MHPIVEIRMAGEQEEQMETAAFLGLMCIRLDIDYPGVV